MSGPLAIALYVLDFLSYGVFAAVLLASLLGLALFAAVNAFGYLMLRRWHASERPK